MFVMQNSRQSDVTDGTANDLTSFSLHVRTVYSMVYAGVYYRVQRYEVKEMSVRSDPVSNGYISERISQIAGNGKANLFITALRCSIIAKDFDSLVGIDGSRG